MQCIFTKFQQQFTGADS